MKTNARKLNSKVVANPSAEPVLVILYGPCHVHMNILVPVFVIM